MTDTAHEGDTGGGGGGDAPRFTVVGGNPTPTELAAVTAVLGALQESSAEPAPVHVRSAWELSQRGLRTPIVPGPGAWRGFSA